MIELKGTLFPCKCGIPMYRCSECWNNMARESRRLVEKIVEAVRINGEREKWRA